ncbi:MAG: hypothetical protein ACKOC5_15985 [Chloroflexota bacterium]
MDDIQLIRRQFSRLAWHVQVYYLVRILWEFHRPAVLPRPLRFSIMASGVAFVSLVWLPTEPTSIVLAFGSGLAGAALYLLIFRQRGV